MSSPLPSCAAELDLCSSTSFAHLAHLASFAHFPRLLARPPHARSPTYTGLACLPASAGPRSYSAWKAVWIGVMTRLVTEVLVRSARPSLTPMVTQSENAASSIRPDLAQMYPFPGFSVSLSAHILRPLFLSVFRRSTSAKSGSMLPHIRLCLRLQKHSFESVLFNLVSVASPCRFKPNRVSSPQDYHRNILFGGWIRGVEYRANTPRVTQHGAHPPTGAP